MSYSSRPEFISKANTIDRVNSGETDESPFASNLVTPTEEQEHLHRGIHERFDIAKTILGYFGSQSFSGEGKMPYEEPCSDVIKMDPVLEMQKNISTGNVGNSSELGEFLNLEEEAKIEDRSHGLMYSLPSILSSLSSFESIQQPRSFYNLPNTHIVVESLDKIIEVEQNSDEVFQEKNAYTTTLDEDSASVMGSDSWALLISAILESSVDLLLFCLRVAFFLPWCIAVGGALIFSPEYLETLAFGTGYIEPLSGIRRYSHWATYGFQHVTSFFTLIGTVVWLSPSIGYLSIGALLAQFCFTWHGFLVDSSIPLGEDDRQTVYLLATTTWLNHDSAIHIKEIGGSYYYSTRSLTTDPGLIDDSDEDIST